MSEWRLLNSLTSAISNGFILIEDEILHKIYLLKCYWNIDKDYVIANNDAKMAIDLEKVWEINPQFNGVIVNRNSNIPFVSSFDENVGSEFIASSNTNLNLGNSHYNISKEYKFNPAKEITLEDSKYCSLIRINLKIVPEDGTKKPENKQSNQDLLAAEVSSQDMELSCLSQTFDRADFLIPKIKTKRKSVVGGILGKKISNASSKVR